MKEYLRAAAFATLLPIGALSLTACGSGDAAPVDPNAPTPCEQLGAVVDDTLQQGGYIVRLAVTKVGDLSVTGDIVDIESAVSQELCKRFNDRKEGKPLQVHEGYERDGTWSSEHKSPCTVLPGTHPVSFDEGRQVIINGREKRDPYVVRIVARYRNSYTGDDSDGNAKYEKRDVCTTLATPGQ